MVQNFDSGPLSPSLDITATPAKAVPEVSAPDGGCAATGHTPPLCDLSSCCELPSFHATVFPCVPSQVHQRVPLFVGSPAEVDYLESFASK